MKRFTTSLLARAFAVAGLLLTGGVAQAAIADYAGSYVVNLASTETPSGEGDPVDVFYGRLDLTLNAKGAATGTLQTRAGKKYSFSTKFVENSGKAVAANKAGENNVGLAKIKGSSAFAINFSLTVNGDGGVEVLGSNEKSDDATGEFFHSSSHKYIKFTGKPASRPDWQGAYTMALVVPDSAGDDVPAGAGYAALSVSATGKLTVKGKLGDGTVLTGSANPIADAIYSFFVKPSGYAAGGYFLAELDLTQRGELAVPALWNKPPKKQNKAYPAGFLVEPIVVLQPWEVPAKKAYPLPTVFGFGNGKNFAVDFSGEGLIPDDVSTLPEVVRVTNAGLIQAVSGGPGSPAENSSKEWNKVWKNVKLNTKTGVFSGKQVLRRTSGKKTTNVVADVGGVFVLPEVLGVEPFAFGQYAVTVSGVTTTGMVTFSGPFENNKVVASAGTYETFALLAMPDASKPLKSPKPKIPMANNKPVVALKYDVSVTDGSERIAYGKVTLVVSEDLQTVKVNGVALKFLSQTGNLRDYMSVLGGVSRTLKLEVNATTGEIEGYILSFQQFMPGRTAAFTCDPNGASANAKKFTSITKK